MNGESLDIPQFFYPVVIELIAEEDSIDIDNLISLVSSGYKPLSLIKSVGIVSGVETDVPDSSFKIVPARTISNALAPFLNGILLCVDSVEDRVIPFAVGYQTDRTYTEKYFKATANRTGLNVLSVVHEPILSYWETSEIDIANIQKIHILSVVANSNKGVV